MESKIANLIIDINKEIVTQYRDQLLEAINSAKMETNISNYGYECRIERAEKCLELTNKILENFQKSIFDGEITEDGKVFRAEYNANGRTMRELMFYSGVSKEQKEIVLAYEGSCNMLEQLGINESITTPIVYHCMQIFTDDNYQIDEGNRYKFKIEEVESKSEGYFHKDGIYEVGDLNINNLLPTKVTLDTGVLIHTSEKPMLYNQYKPLRVNANKIVEIVSQYFSDYIDNDYVLFNEDLNVQRTNQNQFLNDTFQTINNIGFGGFDPNLRIDYYYYNYIDTAFKYREKINGKFFNAPRTSNKMEERKYIMNNKNINSELTNYTTDIIEEQSGKIK